MDKTEKILKEFDDFEQLCGEYKDEMFRILDSLLKAKNLKVHQITHRVKERDKVERKIKRKDEKYETVEDITDIVGLRIITYFEDEVDKIAEVIEEEFEIDRVNTIDKRKLESDRFGYKSLHYVVSLPEHRRKLTENEKFENKKCEIQIRSILQHAWAEIEHDVGYHNEVGIPELAKRNFSRIAALLEAADLDFVRLRNTLSKYEIDVKSKIENFPEDVLLDKTSLSSFMNEDSVVIETDIKILEVSNSRFKKLREPADSYIIKNIERLNQMGIKTIKELKDNLEKFQERIIKFAETWLKFYPLPMETAPRGVSLYYLCFILLGGKSDEKYVKEYFSKENFNEVDLSNFKKAFQNSSN